MKSVSDKEAWTGLANCQDCAIRRSVLFAGLEAGDFDEIHQPIDQISYSAGGQIYGHGEEAGAIITIRSGLVKLTRYLPDGTQRIVRLLQSTDVAGIEALILDHYEHTAVALYDTQICRIPRDLVRDLVSRKPAVFNELMARWHRAISDRDRMITEFNTGPARARVVRLLLWLAEQNQDERCRLFSREDLGALLSLTTETVSRTMAELKRQGYVSEPRPNDILCDIPNLRRLIG